MRDVPSALLEHFQGSLTTLAWCWLITRLDGDVFGFTSHDKDLVIEGVTYMAASGFNTSAAQARSNVSVDNIEIGGLLSSDVITEEDIVAGKWNGATILTFITNWLNVSQGYLIVQRGTIGSITNMNGQFVAEMRSASQLLQNKIGRYYTRYCDAAFGGPRCTVDLAAISQQGTLLAGSTQSQLAASFMVEQPGGTLQFTSGNLEGLSVIIKSLASSDPNAYQPPSFEEYTDPDWADTDLLLQCDTAGSPQTPVIGPSITATNVTQDTSNPKFGYGSIGFGASPVGHLTFTSAPWSGLVEYTWEGWFRLTSQPSGNAKSTAATIFSTYSGAGLSGMQLAVGASTIFFCGHDSSVKDIEGSWTYDTSWHHVAVCREAPNTLRLFLDGALIATATDSVTFPSVGGCYIGVDGYSYVNNTAPYGKFLGVLDEVRFTTAARYTAAFTPQLLAYQEVTPAFIDFVIECVPPEGAITELSYTYTESVNKDVYTFTVNTLNCLGENIGAKGSVFSANVISGIFDVSVDVYYNASVDAYWYLFPDGESPWDSDHAAETDYYEASSNTLPYYYCANGGVPIMCTDQGALIDTTSVSTGGTETETPLYAYLRLTAQTRNLNEIVLTELAPRRSLTTDAGWYMEMNRVGNVITLSIGHGGDLLIPEETLRIAADIGSHVVYVPDCDHTLATCRDTHNNLANFQGFPYIVGIDRALLYPDAVL